MLRAKLPSSSKVGVVEEIDDLELEEEEYEKENEVDGDNLSDEDQSDEEESEKEEEKEEEKKEEKKEKSSITLVQRVRSWFAPLGRTVDWAKYVWRQRKEYIPQLLCAIAFIAVPITIAQAAAAKEALVQHCKTKYGSDLLSETPEDFQR